MADDPGIKTAAIANRLDKKINYGVARTASDATIKPTEEAFASPLALLGETIWKNSANITSYTFNASATNTADVGVCQYVSSLSSGTTDVSITTAGKTGGVLELYDLGVSEEAPYNSSGGSTDHTGALPTNYTAVNAGATKVAKSYFATSVYTGTPAARAVGRLDKWCIWN